MRSLTCFERVQIVIRALRIYQNVSTGGQLCGLSLQRIHLFPIQ